MFLGLPSESITRLARILRLPSVRALLRDLRKSLTGALPSAAITPASTQSLMRNPLLVSQTSTSDRLSMPVRPSSRAASVMASSMRGAIPTSSNETSLAS